MDFNSLEMGLLVLVKDPDSPVVRFHYLVVECCAPATGPEALEEVGHNLTKTALSQVRGFVFPIGELLVPVVVADVEYQEYGVAFEEFDPEFVRVVEHVEEIHGLVAESEIQRPHLHVREKIFGTEPA